MRLSQPELKRARIEIVPMIDTIFFLLVFFMITSLSMVTLKGKKVVLPNSETAKARPVVQLTVTVDRDATFYINEEKVPEQDLVGRLKGEIEDHPDTQVVVNCDKELPVTYVLKVFDYAKRANAAHVMIATSPRNLKSL
jgi:biopolymer transport protein ExbD